jgi:hypothetical protein
MQRAVFNLNGKKIIFMFVPEIPDEFHVFVKGHPEQRTVYIKKKNLGETRKMEETNIRESGGS